MNKDHLANVRNLFSNPSDVTVVSDSNSAIHLFSEIGFESILFNECLNRKFDGESIIIITCKEETLPGKKFLSETFGRSEVLISPLVSFSSSNEDIRYFIEMVGKIDFEDSCKKNTEILHKLESHSGIIRAVSDGNELYIELGHSLEIALPKTNPKISVGEWVSLGQFLEVGLVPNDKYSSFSVNGLLLCDGVSIAHHTVNFKSSRPISREAWDLFKIIREKNGFPLLLEVKDSVVISIRDINRNEYIDKVVKLTDNTFSQKLIEVAFATINCIPNMNWAINSQINEACGGLHIALGTGVDAAHIDFISSFCEIEFC